MFLVMMMLCACSDNSDIEGLRETDAKEAETEFFGMNTYMRLTAYMMVKGLEGAKEYWRRHQDFEMIIVTKDGEVYLTPAAKEKFSLSGSFGNMKIREIM